MKQKTLDEELAVLNKRTDEKMHPALVGMALVAAGFLALLGGHLNAPASVTDFASKRYSTINNNSAEGRLYLNGYGSWQDSEETDLIDLYRRGLKLIDRLGKYPGVQGEGRERRLVLRGYE